MPVEKRKAALLALKELAVRDAEETDESKDAARKREKRSEAARVTVGTCQNPARREACLADPERFLRTYIDYRFTRGFYPHQVRMIEGIYDRARYGGSKSYAAPRGDGKTEVCTAMIVFVMLAGLIDYVVAIAATTKLASDIFKDVKYHFETSPLLSADFPEVCDPIKALEGAPQRAGKQHVDGVLTRIEWKQDRLILPEVDDSPFGGSCMNFYGLDAAIRGVRIRGKRPRLVLVDDPETRESAKSDQQIKDREEMLDRDVAGLGGQEGNVSIVAITTCQNRRSLSWKLTGEDKANNKIKPAYEGERFAAIKAWPTNAELWDDYIAQRKINQNNGDPYGQTATALYMANREAMDEGAEVINPGRYDRNITPEGEPIEISNLQHCYNFISDRGLPSFLAEYQNEPEPEEELQTVGLTSGKVMSRTNTLERRELPEECEIVCLGVDIGKYASHWSQLAFAGNAVGYVTDYGVIETYGLDVSSSEQAIERAILASLRNFADELMTEVKPLIVLVDSGDYSDAVYEFCRSTGPPFFPCKGMPGSNFRMPEQSKTKQPFLEAWAHWIEREQSWLYNVNSWYWKNWVHERFMTDTQTDGVPNDGSLSLFAPRNNKEHLSYAKHIVAEELQSKFEPGKGVKTHWAQVSKNNHWLDATSYACCAAACAGMRLIPQTQRTVSQQVKDNRKQTQTGTGLHGRSFVATQR